MSKQWYTVTVNGKFAFYSCESFSYVHQQVLQENRGNIVSLSIEPTSLDTVETLLQLSLKEIKTFQAIDGFTIRYDLGD